MPEWRRGARQPLCAAYAARVLRRARAPLLCGSGFFADGPAAAARYVDSLTLAALPVSPPCTRPSVMTNAASGGGGGRGIALNSLTKRYGDIVRANAASRPPPRASPRPATRASEHAGSATDVRGYEIDC